MVSSTMSLDNNKKSQHKDTSNLASPSDMSNNNNSNINTSGVSNDSFIPPSEKLSLLFPKCRPRNDANLSNQNPNQTTSGTTMLPSTSTVTTMKTTSMLSSSQSATSNLNPNSSSTSLSQSTLYNNTQPIISNTLNNIENNNNIKQQLKLSPEHNKNCQHSLVTTQIEQRHENYVETNPFRIGNNSNNIPSSENRYDRYYYYNSNSISNSNNMMHPHHLQSSGYSLDSDNKKFFLEPDEVEHNPYMESNRPVMATIPSSVLSHTPPDTPPALTTTPTDLSPIASNRHLWDLSPIKTTTPTKIKNQSPTGALYSGRGLKSSFKKRINSSDEENFERNNYYYSKKSLYQPSQLIADNHELSDTKEMLADDTDLYTKIKSSSRNRMKQSESSDVIYGEAKKKDERKMVKSKSGSGIIGNYFFDFLHSIGDFEMLLIRFEVSLGASQTPHAI